MASPNPQPHLEMPQSQVAETRSFLTSLLNKQMRLYTTDDRMFAGDFKCTDNDCNIILSRAHEYRQPSRSAIEAAASASSVAEADKVRVDMTSRFMGLIVVPGKHITKIEVDE